MITATGRLFCRQFLIIFSDCSDLKVNAEILLLITINNKQLSLHTYQKFPIICLHGREYPEPEGDTQHFAHDGVEGAGQVLLGVHIPLTRLALLAHEAPAPTAKANILQLAGCQAEVRGAAQ